MFAKKALKYLLPLMLLSTVLLSSCQTVLVSSKDRAVQKVADKISGYTIPDGYKVEFGVDFMGYQLVNFNGATPSCHIYLVQAPKDADVDIADLQRQARSLEGAKETSNHGEMQVVETRTTQLRGQDVPLIVTEGQNGEGLDYRAVMALFDGRGGPAMVSVSAPQSEWDWALVDDFLASIE